MKPAAGNYHAGDDWPDIPSFKSAPEARYRRNRGYDDRRHDVPRQTQPNPFRQRRREWRRVTHLYRDTNQFCINGQEDGDVGMSVTTASTNDDRYSAIQNWPSAKRVRP